MITKADLSKVMRYAGNGEFIWLVGRRNGLMVGSITQYGYLITSVKREKVFVHRLIWLHHHGKFPENQIDHINGIRTDNRITNLRDVTNLENHRNQKQCNKNTSGVMGVVWNKKRQKWQAQISVKKKNIYLGLYEDLELAELVRKEAEHKLESEPPANPELLQCLNDHFTFTLINQCRES